MRKPPPLYAEAARHAPASVTRWENSGWLTPSPALRRLLGLLLTAALAYALASCRTTRAETARHATETAAPAAAARHE